MALPEKIKEYKFVLNDSENNDNRVNIFLSELFAQSKKTKGAKPNFESEDIKITDKSTVFQPSYFSSGSSSGYGYGYDYGSSDIHPEWDTFLNDINIRYNNITNFNIYQDALNRTQNSTDIFDNFMNVLLNKLFDVSTGTFKQSGTNVNKLFDATTFKSILHEPVGTSSNIKDFNIKIDGPFLNSFFKEALTRSHVPVDILFGPSKKADAQQYFRVNDKLCRMVNGVPIEVGYNSSEYISIVNETDYAKSKCVSTGIGGNDSAKCQRFITNCLYGKDIDSCKDFLQDPDYWRTAIDEVENMNPEIAIRLLTKLEFRKVVVPVKYYTDKKVSVVHLNQMETFAQWLENLYKSGKLNEESKTKISNNRELRGYIDMVVSKINGNPAILNSDYNEKQGVRRLNRDSYLSRIGLQLKPKTLLYAPDAVNHLVRMTYERSPVNIVNMNRVFSQFGGIPNSPSQYYINSEDEEKLGYTSGIFLERFSKIERQLGAFGKSINNDDKRKILDLIESLKKTEITLHKFIIYTNAFISLMETHGEYISDKVLNLENLKNLVDTRTVSFTKAQNKTSALSSIFDKITSITNQ
jgi:hypothetical protein